MFEKWLKKSPPKPPAEKQEPLVKQDIALREKVIEALRGIYDPELPVNIYDLGLIYEIRAIEDGKVYVQMTLTTPNCPVAQSFPRMVAGRIKEIEGVTAAKVLLVWDPPWSSEMMSEAARLELGMF